MGQAVLKVDNDTINKIRAFYEDHLVEPTPPGAAYRAKTDHCAITAYNSGKVLFQGKKAEEEVKRWQALSNTTPLTSKSQRSKKSVDAHDYRPPEQLRQLSIIGSDEVGTGDYFGPITVCAVYSRPEDGEWLKALGVRDSKTLTDAKMQSIVSDITSKVVYSLLILPNEKYNRLVDKGYSQTKIKAILHHHVLLNVLKKADGKPIDGCLIDQFVKPESYFKAIAGESESISRPLYFLTHAENAHPSVACASIIARCAFIREIERLSKLSGRDLPKGAGAGVDQAAAELIREKGVNFLNQVAKVHFANTAKARRLAE